MLKSRADSTTKAYVRLIGKVLDWSKSRHFNMQLPFPLSVVSLCLFEVQQSCASSSSVTLAHAALKRLHSFAPSVDRNPLDSDICRNIIEASFEKEAYFQRDYKDFLKYMVGGNLIPPRICMLKNALKTGCM